MKYLKFSMQKFSRIALLLFACLLIATTMLIGLTTAHAAANDKINYQGKLYTSGGSPVTDGSHTMVFKFYAAASGGTALWTESQTISTTGGLFTALLGSVTSLSGIDWNQALYLGVTVDTDSEMTPRHTVGAVPAAHTIVGTLGVAQGGTGTSTQFTSGAVLFAGANGVYSGNANQLFISTTTGNIGIGTTSPLAKLDIYGTAGSSDIFAISSSTYSRLFTVTAAGNVGIGTSTPTAQLHTTGSVRFETFGSGTLTTDANGNLSVSSDERLKNITGSFDTGLAAIRGLEPIRYRWNATSGLETESIYAGFSAQNVLAHIEDAVGIDKKTGYFTLSDRPIIAASVNAIKELDITLESLASTTSATSTDDGVQTFAGRFFDRMIAWFADTANGIGSFFAKSFRAEETICVGNTCIGETELTALLENAGVTSSSDNYNSEAVITQDSGTVDTATSTDTTATSTESTATTTDTTIDTTATTTEEVTGGGTGTTDAPVNEEPEGTPVVETVPPAEETTTVDSSTEETAPSETSDTSTDAGETAPTETAAP